jgi:hypothetical protein
MARTVINTDDHTQGLLDALAALPFPVGDAVMPRGANKEETDPPFVVLYPIVGGSFDGPLSDTQADVHLNYQVTSVGETRFSAQAALDLVRAILLDKSNVTITGRSIRDIRLVTPFAGVIRDDDLPNPLFYGYDRYELDTTPV